MRKPLIPRICGLLVLYCAVFVTLVTMQFAKKGNFIRRIGAMTVSGQYRMSEDREEPANANEYFLTAGALVSFGGLEFNLKNREDALFDENGFILIDAAGERRPAIPGHMILQADTVLFRLSGGTEIAFNTLYSGSGP